MELGERVAVAQNRGPIGPVTATGVGVYGYAGVKERHQGSR